ncbi:MAG: aminomethyltransferase family protein, partial [Actinomycetes bacterium]
FETAGWERPHWYESNAPLLEEYGDRVARREAEWESRWWSPIVNAEHLAMREGAGLIDLSAFNIFDVLGPGALATVQRVAVSQMDVPVGRVVYTPVLNGAGGIKSDLTIMRLGDEHFRVVTGGLHGNADRKWFADHAPDDGTAQIVDQTNAFTTIGLWGPKAREILAKVTRADVSHDGFRFGTCREIEIGSQVVLASRISYVGELGWELYVSFEQGARLWQTLYYEGLQDGLVPVGIGVYGTTGRLEKGYRAHGAELDLERTVVEAGLTRKSVKEQDFVGKAALLEQLDADPVTILCTLTVDDHTSADGTKRYMLGREPVLTVDGEPIADKRGHRSYVTSAGSAPSLGKHLLMAYLPPDYAVEGIALKVEYMAEQYPVTVARVGARPLFDPANDRIRG